MADQLSTELVDALSDIHGAHPGFRTVHSKGLCCKGTFWATDEASELTTAHHMQGGPIPATVRFSSGSGVPTRADGARDGRGMATRFHLPDGRNTDLVALTLPAFFVRTPEDFLEFTRAQKPDPGTGKPDLAKIERFVTDHPETQLAIGFSMFSEPPASYAQCRYFGIHAFEWEDASGNKRFVRYRWEPGAGVATISEEESRARGKNYLQEELRARLESQGATFTLYLQLAGDGDDPTDPTTPWPDEREVVEAGRMEITQLSADAEEDCESQVFDPTRVIDGINCSDDRILHARPGAYSVSYERRMASRAHQ